MLVKQKFSKYINAQCKITKWHLQTDISYLSECDKEITNSPYVSMKVERLIM